MSYEEPKSRFSFGNILLSLLLLGTITVIGLIVLVYFKLTSPSERTTVAPVQASAPARPVEKWVPNGASVANASEAASNPNVRQPPLLIPYSAQNPQNKDADDAVNALNSDNKKYNSRALTDGATVQRKQPVRRRTNTENTATATENTTRSNRSNTRNQQAAEETPLQPINKPRERTLTPRNTAAAPAQNNPDRPRRTYTAPPRNPEPQTERVLTPNRPARKSNDAIDELF